MQQEDHAHQHYRVGCLGRALQDALDEFVQEGKLTPEQAVSALLHFDQQANKNLKQPPEVWMGLEGDIVTYKNVDNVWNWTLKDTTVCVAQDEAGLKPATKVSVGTMNVIATDAYPGRVVSRSGRKKKTN